MSSRYFVSKQLGRWPGVCEVPDGQDRIYYHHRNWPKRTSDGPLSFLHGSFAECTDPVSGHWIPMIDEDLQMDDGL